MKILTYECKDPSKNGWEFSKVAFGNINLLVSNSGMGKTRLLNTLFNLGSQISHKKLTKNGIWDLCLEVDDIKYEWKLISDTINGEKPEVIYERLLKIENGISTTIFLRNAEKFLFNNKELPKLSKNESCISLLCEEPDITPLFKGFGKILRRRFFEAELSDWCRIEGFPYGFLDNLLKNKKLSKIYPQFHTGKINLNAIMYILNNKFSDLFDKICDIYKTVFSFITEIKILEMQEISNNIKIPGQIPVFCIKEKNVNKWIKLNELSSGMQKVLLILTDIFTLPNSSIYLIDEYENSLGINAINFFPNLLFEEDFDIQFIVTSHHPYIINKIPINNWYMLHRKGSVVKILYGEKLKERFGTSKQQAFIKLLNDSFFLEGKV